MKSTNTFENGLNQDVNVNLQPRGTYRDLHNGMLISYDGNHYVVETALGNQVNFTIPARYSDTSFNKEAPPLPIGFISFIDTLVVFSTNDSTSTGGYGEIGIVNFDNNGDGTYEPLYHHNDLNFTKEKKIRGFSYAENDLIERVYWSDNLNDNRVLNIQDPMFSATASGSLVANEVYMVVGGAIEYPPGSGQYYGPGIPGNTNVFTANMGAAYTVADSLQAGYPKVYPYIDYHLLSWTPDRIMGSIDFVKALTGGSVNCGAKMFFYRLKLANQGFETSWSYGSAPINLPKTFASNWKDQQGGGAGSVLTNSAHGIEIQISNIDTRYDTIEVAVAEFDQTNNTLTDAKVIISTDVTGATMNFQYYGAENVAELSVNDLTIFPASVLHSKDLCTVKNYIAIANLTEREEIDFDESTVTIADITYDTPGDVFGDDIFIVKQGSIYQPAAGIPLNGVVADGRYVVTGGTITYNAVVYGPGAAAGATFVGAPGVINWVVTSGAPVVNAAIIIKKYTDGGGNDVNKVIPILDDYFDYKGMAATQYLRQYWTNETYRFGILFYDLKGNPYFVRWIGDHQIWNTPNVSPPVGVSNKGGFIKDNGFNQFSLRLNGLSISGIEISPTLAALVSGFSIVRAPRDRQYFAQGVIFPTVNDSPNCRPMSEDRLANDEYYSTNGGVTTVYTWHSPDALFGSSIFNPENTGNKLEGEFFAAPVNAAVPFVQVAGGGDQYFTKFYKPDGVAPSNPFSLDITTYAEVTPNGSYGGIYPGFSFENTLLKQAGFAPSAGMEAVGGNCSIIRTSSAIYYNSQDIINWANLQAKPIANYKVSKGSLYGGQSESAIANTPFISTGHFQEINSSVLATLPVSGGNYVFNDVMVFGGDSFLGIFDHAKALYDSGFGAGSYSYGIFTPLESNVNHYMRQGRNLAKDGMQVNNPSPSDGIWFFNGGTSQLEEFLVNDAYSSDGDAFQYPALPVNFTDTGRFPFRTRWNGAKIAGESTDIFRTFPVNQFRDLDGRAGEINNIITKAGRLFAIQDDAVNYLPVLERQLVNGDVGAATQLGVGGVIDRFDVINSYFGNQHQNSLVETEYGFTWFDMRRRAWVIMTIGGDVQEISAIKGLQSFFNRVFEDQNINNNPIYNTDTPLMGIGIHGVYDPQFKTTFLTFKNYVNSAGDSLNYDFTVGYNHTRNVIVGFFDFNPAIWHSHNRYLLSAKNAGASATTAAYTYEKGDEVSQDGTQYVDVEELDFTTHSPLQLWELPDFPSSNIWTKLYAENEVFVHWKESAGICKFYGRVYPLVHEVIITPNAGEPVAVDNLQIKSSIATNYDTMEFFTDNDSASDTNLNLGNRNYRVRDNAWESSLPLGTYGRLVDYYLKVRMTLRNYTTNPTVANNVQKVTAFLNSVWRVKR